MKGEALMQVWTENSLTRVLPAESPAGRERPALVSLAAARGGHASFQVLVRTAREGGIRELRIETGALLHEDGRQRIGPGDVTWHAVGFVRIERTQHPHWRAPSLPPGWYPDPLLPVRAVDVPAEFTQPLWVTLRVPTETRAGVYEGALAVRAHGCEPISIRVRARVFDVVVPPGAGRFRTSFDLIEGFLEQIYGQPLPRRMARRYGEFLLAHRLNPDHFSRNEPPRLDDLRHYRGLGLNSFCVINLAKHRGASIRGGLNSAPEWYTERNWAALDRRVAPFLRQLRKETDLWRMAYVHGFDERDIGTHGKAMRLFFGRVRERWGLPTLTTSHLPTDARVMKELGVSWLCPIWAQYRLSYRLRRAEKARAAGAEVWSYISLMPYPPFPNWRMDSPLSEARTIWWQTFQQKMDGFLYWGVNVWDRQGNDRPIVPGTSGPLLDFSISTGGTHDWLHGDGVLLYPGAHGPIGSLRLANIRDGLEDYELLRHLAERRGEEAARRFCRPVAAGLGRFTRAPRAVLRRRLALLRRIERASALPATGTGAR